MISTRFIRSTTTGEGGGEGGRIIIPSFSPARILLGSSFILRAQRFPREQVEGQVEDPSIDRSIDHTPLKDAPPLPPVQGWSERSRARTHDRYNHVGRRDLICRWRSVNWRQSHGRRLPPSLPPSFLSPLRALLLLARCVPRFLRCLFSTQRGRSFHQAKYETRTALFRNRFLPVSPVDRLRTALDPLSLSPPPRSSIRCHISCDPRPNLASRNFSKLPCVHTPAPRSIFIGIRFRIPIIQYYTFSFENDLLVQRNNRARVSKIN